jgi:hypothetical protein
VREAIRSFLLQLMVEGPATRQGLEGLRAKLQRSGDELSGRLDKVAESETTRRVVDHIITIERWGQRRLKVALGETLPPIALPLIRTPNSHWRGAKRAVLDNHFKNVEWLISRACKAQISLPKPHLRHTLNWLRIEYFGTILEAAYKLNGSALSIIKTFAA